VSVTPYFVLGWPAAGQTRSPLQGEGHLNSHPLIIGFYNVSSIFYSFLAPQDLGVGVGKAGLGSKLSGWNQNCTKTYILGQVGMCLQNFIKIGAEL